MVFRILFSSIGAFTWYITWWVFVKNGNLTHMGELPFGKKTYNVVYHSKASEKLSVMLKTTWKMDQCINFYEEMKYRSNRRVNFGTFLTINLDASIRFSSGFLHDNQLRNHFQVIYNMDRFPGNFRSRPVPVRPCQVWYPKFLQMTPKNSRMFYEVWASL